jgi:hypothetical protein
MENPSAKEGSNPRTMGGMTDRAKPKIQIIKN